VPLDDLDARAERLYAAVAALLHETGTMGLLVAAGDAKDRIPWNDAHTKTRELFRHLAVNLTERPPIA
jgi:hypothetical protein